jgi:hypothetical protein
MLAVLVFARVTFAEPTAAEAPAGSPDAQLAKLAEALVQRELVHPLAVKEQERSRFSRASLPAQERRVRILDERPRKDAAGGAFLRFAVDERHGIATRTDDDPARWRLATVTGCVYLGRNQVFVKKGDGYRLAAFLLGKNLKPAAEPTCQAEPAEVARTR